MTYDGFISYSHAADGQLAPAVQRGLQRFAKPWYRRRALNVFRDDTGLSVAPHLWGAVSAAMDDAEWFVLLTSPEAAQSRWVNREIEHWRATKPVERILPVVTSGEWVWDERTGDFDWEHSTAVPEALRGAFEDEPRHLDLQWARDEAQLDARHSRFRDAIAQLAAPLHGVSKDELESEDIRRHRRAVRLAWGTGVTMLVLLVAAVVGGVVAVTNADRAEQRRKEADSQRLAAQSEQNADRPDLAFLLAAAAHAIDPTLQAEGAVLRALQIDPDLRRYVRGHDDEVWAAAVVPDHDLVASGTASGQILLTDRTSGETVLESPSDDLPRDDPAPIVSFARIDADTLWAIDSTGGIVQLSLADRDDIGVEVRRLGEAPEILQDATVDPTGTRLAAGAVDGTLTMWDLDDLDEPVLDVVVSDVDVYTVEFSPEGDRLAAGTGDSLVSVRDTATGALLWDATEALPGSDPSVTGLTFTEDGDALAGVGANGALQIWDAATGEPRGAEGGVIGPHLGRLTDVADTGVAFPQFDEAFLATAGEDGQVVYWDPATLTPLTDPNRVHSGAVNEVSFASDGSFVTAGADRVAAYFETDRSRLASGARRDAGEPVATVALSPDEQTVAVSSGPEGTVSLWDVDEQAPTGASITAGTVVQDLVYDPSGRWLVGALAGGQILLWDTERDTTDLIDAHAADTIDVAMSPDGEQVLSSSPLADEAKLWDLFDGELIERDTVDDVPFARGGEFSPDGRSVAIAAGPPADVVFVELDDAGRVDSRTVLTVGDGTLDATWDVAFHPSEPLLAAVGSDAVAHFWDLDTYSRAGEPLVGHRDGITDIAFLGDGDRIVTTSEDTTVRLWDLARREPIGAPLQGHEAIVFAVAPTDDGDAAISGSSDGTLVFWDLDVEDWIAAGCALVGRDFTDAERERFGLEDAPATC